MWGVDWIDQSVGINWRERDCFGQIAAVFRDFDSRNEVFADFYWKRTKKNDPAVGVDCKGVPDFLQLCLGRRNAKGSTNFHQYRHENFGLLVRGGSTNFRNLLVDFDRFTSKRIVHAMLCGCRWEWKADDQPSAEKIPISVQKNRNRCEIPGVDL